MKNQEINREFFEKKSKPKLIALLPHVGVLGGWLCGPLSIEGPMLSTMGPINLSALISASQVGSGERNGEGELGMGTGE